MQRRTENIYAFDHCKTHYQLFIYIPHTCDSCNSCKHRTPRWPTWYLSEKHHNNVLRITSSGPSPKTECRLLDTVPPAKYQHIGDAAPLFIMAAINTTWPMRLQQDQHKQTTNGFELGTRWLLRMQHRVLCRRLHYCFHYRLVDLRV